MEELEGVNHTIVTRDNTSNIILNNTNTILGENPDIKNKRQRVNI